MRIFLIRHGETVDNVANLYAGVRDSALTIHGNLQAERLGRYLAAQSAPLTHIFASNLQRAFKTANAIADAQSKRTDVSPVKLDVVQVEALREQNFGFYEGKPFYARPKGSDRSGKEEHRARHAHEPDFKDVETKESMAQRADSFLDDYIVPMILIEEILEDTSIAVVSHGIMLSSLWRRLLRRFGQGSVSLAPGISVGNGAPMALEYLGGWSNTGFLELEITETDRSLQNDATTDDKTGDGIAEGAGSKDDGMLKYRKMVIKTVNGKEHLAGLKRTRGVSSSQHDEGQQRMEAFFKKPKV